MRIARLITVTIIGGMIILSSCARSPVTPVPVPTPAPYTIRIVGFAYVPSTLTVPVGTTVTWTNEDSNVHTVSSYTGLFGGILAVGTDTPFSYTFTEPGTFEYYDELYSDWNMVGKIIVK